MKICQLKRKWRINGRKEMDVLRTRKEILNKNKVRIQNFIRKI